MNETYVLKRVNFILDLIEKDISVDDIRNNLKTYLFSNVKNKIVINETRNRSFGFTELQVQISDKIVRELAKRGDEEARLIIYRSRINKHVQGHYIDPEDYTYAYINRNNQSLIKLIEEGTMQNNGNNTLVIYEVPEDFSAYTIMTEGFQGEFISGAYKIICEMNSYSGDEQPIEITVNEMTIRDRVIAFRKNKSEETYDLHS